MKEKKLRVIELIENFEQEVGDMNVVPMTGRVLIGKSTIENFLTELKEILPSEYMHVQELYYKIDEVLEKTKATGMASLQEAEAKAENIVKNAQTKANDMLARAKEQSAKMISEHEITRNAEAKARSLRENAIREARHNVESSLNFAKTKLHACEGEVSELLKNIHNQKKRYEAEYIERTNRKGQ